MNVSNAMKSDTSALFREEIRQLTGISLPASKAPMIEQRLRKRVIASGAKNTDAYLQALLKRALPEEELGHVIDLITTNTTGFFREAEHFDFLRETAVPEAMAKAGNRKLKLKVWSAAASEGAEAYTTAMVLSDMVRSGANMDWAILGTDLSQRMIQKARLAVYDDEQMSTVPADMARRYTMTSQDPKLAKKVRIVPEIRSKVRFRRMNLMDASYPIDMDVNVIFLRNILIYFDADDKAAVVDKICRHLLPGGYLIVGHAESMIVRSHGLNHVRPTIFQKASE